MLNNTNSDLSSAANPEQKLRILCSEMATPIEVIRGCIVLIQKHYESDDNQSAELLECIRAIAQSASYLKKLREESL